MYSPRCAKEQAPGSWVGGARGLIRIFSRGSQGTRGWGRGRGWKGSSAGGAVEVLADRQEKVVGGAERGVGRGAAGVSPLPRERRGM